MQPRGILTLHGAAIRSKSIYMERVFMNATIDRDGCISCGLCPEICPEVFRIAEDGVAEAYGEVTRDNVDNAKRAENSCPVSVISVEE